MRRVFSNTWLMSIVSVLTLLGNFYWSVTTCEVHWFQRSGSIVVLLGVIIAARPIIRLGKEYQNEDWNLPNESLEGKMVLLDQRAEFLFGPLVALVGTIVWGYGDLFMVFFIN